MPQYLMQRIDYKYCNVKYQYVNQITTRMKTRFIKFELDGFAPAAKIALRYFVSPVFLTIHYP